MSRKPAKSRNAPSSRQDHLSPSEKIDARIASPTDWRREKLALFRKLFHQGAILPDPKNVFNAGLDGNKWRAIDFHEGDELDESAFMELVRQAVAFNTRKNE